MNRRLTLFLLLLVLLPSALVGWLGHLLWQGEQQRWESERSLAASRQLQAQQMLLDAHVQAIASQITALLEQTKADASSLLEIPTRQPMIRSAFAIDAAGHLIVPDPGKPAQLSAPDLDFLQRTNAVWNTARALGAPAQSETSAISAASAAPRGWHVWYHDDGPQWLYWQSQPDGSRLGVEVERAAFLSQLLARLGGNDDPGCIRLVGNDGNVLYQQGQAQPIDNAIPLNSLACAWPMQHWHWEYLAADVGHAGPKAWPWMIGIGGVVALLLSIGFLLFATYRRDMALATQRVSFVNQVSHELKTPLTNIRLYGELARDSASGEARGFLDIVDEETQRLSRMIHNVLTFARHEKQGLELQPREGNLTALIVKIVQQWRPLLARKNITLAFEPEQSLNAIFDPDATEQILGNLLSNIEKYAHEATEARITLTADAKHAEVIVHDNGCGIPNKAAKRLFEPFYRARSDITEGTSGTGLGLSIARQLAQAQGATLDHIPSNGAAFRLRLPRQVSRLE